MSLINTKTLDLEEFVSKPPRCAILSHTWEDGEEISYQEMRDQNKPTVESLVAQLAALLNLSA
jgi:hypothetical protein